jgi:hypothetical protein
MKESKLSTYKAFGDPAASFFWTILSFTEHTGLEVTVQTPFRKVPGLNLSQEAGYPE